MSNNNNVSIVIERINVMINSNIPGKPPFLLKSSMLHSNDINPGKPMTLSELPYFTKDVKYPLRTLYKLRSTGYRKILKFFFNKENFESVITSSLNNNKESEKTGKRFNGKRFNGKRPNGKQSNNREPNDTEIIDYNINVMMELLFPTTFPSMRNFTSSFDPYISNTQITDISFKGMISSNKFSYFKLDDKSYTVSKVTWLNDLLNHPVYKNFIDEFASYREWVKRESNSINILFDKKSNAIKERLSKKYTKQNTLYIFGEIEKFNGNQLDEKNDKNLIDLMNSKDYRDYETKKFYDNLKSIIDLLTELNKAYGSRDIEDKKNKEGKTQEEDIVDLYSKISGISELYKRLTENRTVTLKGIPTSFKSKLQILLEELQKLNALIKIKTLYITESEVNIKLGEEDPDVLKILKENYSQFIDYIEKVKLLLYPIRESSNKELQQAIINFSENNREKDELVFETLMKKVKEELIFLKSKKYFNNSDNVKRMYTGVCSIDKNKLDAPHYEIYLGIDFFEGEINDTNLESIKCKYRGLYLGQETELFFSKYNPYDFYKHRVYVSEVTKENPNEKDKKQRVNQKEKEKPPISGGRKTRKNRRKSLTRTQKRF